eukprot:TRINITY_DN195_c1_g6_i2.p1 TRINITY_DN195_c1_g6~~TRINITY_DN195_c1_g6_i2.p1  ORF type:complete len:642 (+),score=255.60 TRINITY_DN195_c1_g6_i2:21-1946(+)
MSNLEESNIIDFFFELNTEDDLTKSKLQILEKCELSIFVKSEVILNIKPKSFPKDLLSISRICCLSDEEIYIFSQFKTFEFISSHNEMKAFSLLKTMLRNLKEQTILKVEQLKKKLNNPNNLNNSNSISNSNSNSNNLNINFEFELLKLNHFLKNLNYLKELLSIECFNFCSKQKPMIATNINNDQCEKNFFNWLKQNSINFAKVSCVDFIETGRGLMINDGVQIEDDEIIFQLPRNLILNANSARGSIIECVLENFLGSIPDDDTLLIVFILYEKFANPNSFWKAYLDFLPNSIDLCLLYDSIELSELSGIPLLSDVYEARQNLLENFELLFPALTEFAPDLFSQSYCTWENFLWIRSIFDSRAFLMRIDDRDVNCLLPLVDLCNTSHYPLLSGRGRFNVETQCYEIRSLSKFNGIKKSLQINNDKQEQQTFLVNQLFLTYGPYSNRELFLHYGFIETNNPYDRCCISLEFPEEEEEDFLNNDSQIENFQMNFEFEQKFELLKIKKQLIELHKLSLENNYLYLNLIPTKLLAVVRICVLNFDDIIQIQSKNSNNWQSIDPHQSEAYGKNNEKQALITLKQTLESVAESFEEFSGSIEQDKIKLINEKINNRIKNAIEYRLIQKTIIRIAINQIKNQLSIY